jgi:hypothetical protein
MTLCWCVSVSNLFCWAVVFILNPTRVPVKLLGYYVLMVINIKNPSFWGMM